MKESHFCLVVRKGSGQLGHRSRGRMRSLISRGTHSATRLCYEVPCSSHNFPTIYPTIVGKKKKAE